MYGVSVEKCVGVWGEVRGEVWGVWRKVRGDGGCKEVWREVWESVWGERGRCGEVCWGSERGSMRYMGEGKGRCRDVKKCAGRCGRPYGVSV